MYKFLLLFSSSQVGGKMLLSFKNVGGAQDVRVIENK